MADLYNKLFTVSGDYVSNKLTQIKENLGFSGDYEEEKVFLDLISGDYGDFVISWNSYTPHFSLKGQQINNVQMISGDTINFSQLERENPKLHEVMEWTRTILGFSLGFLLIRNYWNTILHTLGIGTQIYDSADGEKESIKVEFDKKGNRTEVHSKNIGGVKYTWRR